MQQLLARDPHAIQKVLTDPDAFATTLVTLLLDQYGGEALSWAPETIRMQLAEDFGAQMPRANFDRLMAAVVVLTTDNFFTSLPDFIELCNVLSGSAASPDVFDPADPLECAWGITEALLLSPPDEEDYAAGGPFSDEICRYVGEVLNQYGYATPPDVLRIAMGNKPAAEIQHEWADDPVFSAAVFETQQGKTKEVEETIRENLDELIGQLESLPLTSGNAKGLRQRLRGRR